MVLKNLNGFHVEVEMVDMEPYPMMLVGERLIGPSLANIMFDISWASLAGATDGEMELIKRGGFICV